MSQLDKLIKKFLSKSVIKDDHWLWMGARNSTGYGVVTIKRKMYYVHRYIFCLKNELDYHDKFMACHTCNIPYCWNPDHLYKGDSSSNMIDAVRIRTHHESRKTHCSKGHDFSIHGKLDKYGHRRCIMCVKYYNGKESRNRKYKLKRNASVS